MSLTLILTRSSSQMKFASERRAELGQDMEALNGQLTRKKAKLEELEELMRRRVRELQELESLGLTRADVRIYEYSVI